MQTDASSKNAIFERDVRAYLDVLPNLLKDSEGKFVLIGQADFKSVYETREEAMEAGYQKFGMNGFLVQEILARDLDMGNQWLKACQP